MCLHFWNVFSQLQVSVLTVSTVIVRYENVFWIIFQSSEFIFTWPWPLVSTAHFCLHPSLFAFTSATATRVWETISNVSTCCDISCERVWYRFLRNPTDSVCSLKCAQFWHNCDLHGFWSTEIANLTTLNRFIDRIMYKRNQSEFQNSSGNNVLKHGIRFNSYLPPTGAS